MRPWVRTRKHKSGRESLYVLWKEKVRGADGKSRWELQRLLVRDGKEKTANRIADKIATEIAERGWINRPRRSLWTLGELAEVYLERSAQERPKSDAFRRARVAHLLRIIGPGMPIEEITKERAAEYARQRLAERWKRTEGSLARAVSAATVNHERNVLKRMLRLASEDWRDEVQLSEYRLVGLRPLSTAGRSREPIFLSPAQRARLLEAAAEVARERGTRRAKEGELLVRLALSTGARVGEILAMTWESLSGDRWTLRAQKGGQDRAIRLPPEIRAALSRLRPRRAPAGAVFELPRRTAPKDAFAAYWREVRRRAGVACRFHDLRHTFASVAAAGRPMRLLQRDLGHRTMRMTERYAKFASDAPPSESLSLKDLVPDLVPARKRRKG